MGEEFRIKNSQSITEHNKLRRKKTFTLEVFKQTGRLPLVARNPA